MKKLHLLGVCAYILTLLSVNTTHAATITLNIDIDLDDYTTFIPTQYARYAKDDISVTVPTLSSGDIIDTTINFINGKRLVLSDTSSVVEQIGVTFYKDNSAGGQVTSSTSITLLGVNGDLLGNPIYGSNICTTCVAGVATGNFTNSSFSFSGLRAITTITSIPEPFGSERAQFYAYSSTGTIGISTIPVPAAIWLFGSGLIGLIGFARRKTE